jgi:tRNA (mo5U34)-methyltransferase
MRKYLTEQEIRDEVNRLAPFHHNVELPYGLSTHIPELSRRPLEVTRLSNLVKHAFPALIEVCGGSLRGKRVLDVACNCGGFSVQAAKLNSEYVLGIDVVDHYIEQAVFLKCALGLENTEFEVMDIDNLDESTVGKFDVTFCFGILYHLENPIRVMRKLASITKSIMLVDTTVVRTQTQKMPLWVMHSPSVSTVDSIDVTTSRWRREEGFIEFYPNEKAVADLLRFLGFSEVAKIEPEKKGLEKRYYTGDRVTFLAKRS